MIYNKNTDGAIPNAVVTGTPGIGKTTFRNFMIPFLISKLTNVAVKTDFMICVDISPSDANVEVLHMTYRGGLWKWNAYSCQRTSYSIFLDTHKCFVWYLVDVSQGNACNIFRNANRSVMFTCPNEKAYHDICKEKCILYYMPTWSWDESLCYNLLMQGDEEVLLQRFTKYGGISRALFASAGIYGQYEQNVAVALNKFDEKTHFKYVRQENCSTDIRHMLMYFNVTENYRNSELVWGSDHILQLVTAKFIDTNEYELDNVLDQ